MRKNKDEYYTKKNVIRKKYMRMTIRIFFGLLLVFGFIGLLFPLRPKESDVEKRIFQWDQYLVRRYFSFPRNFNYCQFKIQKIVWYHYRRIVR